MNKILITMIVAITLISSSNQFQLLQSEITKGIVNCWKAEMIGELTGYAAEMMHKDLSVSAIISKFNDWTSKYYLVDCLSRYGPEIVKQRLQEGFLPKFISTMSLTNKCLRGLGPTGMLLYMFSPALSNLNDHTREAFYTIALTGVASYELYKDCVPAFKSLYHIWVPNNNLGIK